MNNKNIPLILILGLIVLVSVLIAWTNRGIKGDVTIQPVENSVNQFNSTPTSDKNVGEVLKSNPEFSKFVELLESQNMVSALEGLGPFTVLAPTNQAFDNVDPLAWAELVKDQEDLVAVIGYHFLPQIVTTSTINSLPELITISNREIQVTNNLGGNSLLNGAEIVTPNQPASNGIVHGIDTVLIPQDEDEEDVGELEL